MAWNVTCGWCRTEDRQKQGALREGMREGFTLGRYLMLVDYTSRLVRDGKASVTAEVESIFTRLGSNAESLGARMLKLSGARLLGRFLSASRNRLREIALALKNRIGSSLPRNYQFLVPIDPKQLIAHF